MILVGLSQGLQDHGPDLHTSEVGHNETSHNGRRLLFQVSILSGSLISTKRSTGSSVHRCARPVTLATCSLTPFKPFSVSIKGWHDPHHGRTVWQCLQEMGAFGPRTTRPSRRLARLARVHGNKLAKVASAETMIPCNWRYLFSRMSSVRMSWWSTMSRTFDALDNDTVNVVLATWVFKDAVAVEGDRAVLFGMM